jgi:hypothetical protein
MVGAFADHLNEKRINLFQLVAYLTVDAPFSYESFLYTTQSSTTHIAAMLTWR